MEGLVVFSFALRKEEPSPCNVRLAKAVERILSKAERATDVLVVSQWEVAKQLIHSDNFIVDVTYLTDIGQIGFDGESLQPWTRSSFQLLWYAVKQAIFGRKNQVTD